MNSTPVIDMFSGTGQLAVAATRAIHEPGHPRAHPHRVVLRHLQARLMLQRGLTAVNDTRGTL